MKLIIDIPEEDREDINNIHFVREDLKFKVGKAIMNGISFDSIIEDIKAEIEEKSVWYRGQTYDGLCIALQIIDKHISGKEKE